MLDTVRRAFKIEDVRKRLFYTFMMLIVVRLGSELPTPGVDPTYIQNFFASQSGDAFNFRRLLYTDVGVCIEHNTVHHIFYHHTAVDNCNSKTGRNAERWSGW